VLENNRCRAELSKTRAEIAQIFTKTLSQFFQVNKKGNPIRITHARCERITDTGLNYLRQILETVPSLQILALNFEE